MIIVPEMIGSVIAVYNGKTFNQIEVKGRRAWGSGTFGSGSGLVGTVSKPSSNKNRRERTLVGKE
eukprot:9021428-Pyramimonas_sp.AAC.1